jgi:GABA(A) receptor-associated protein
MSKSSKESFKKLHPEDKRKLEAKRIREKYPDRVPVIVEKDPKASIADIDKKKFLVPQDLTYGQMLYVIRKRINLKPSEAIFVFINKALPPTGQLMSQLYKEYKDEYGFLYCTYTGENTFGGDV